jgi:hypothetical protein
MKAHTSPLASFEPRRKSAEHLRMRSSVLAARFRARVLRTKQKDEAVSARAVAEAQLDGGLPAIKGKRNAGRRIVSCPHASGVRDAPRRRRLAPPSACGRARLPAFHCGFRQRDFRPEGSASGQASRRRCESCGVPHAPPVRSQRCTSRAGLIAGRHDARAARVRSVSFRPRAPHSLRRLGVPSQKASSYERDWLRLLPSPQQSQSDLNFSC